jgi:DNA-binding LytR/AlgR family response regulator
MPAVPATSSSLRCLIVDDDPLALQVLENCIEHTDFLQLAGRCASAIEAAALLRTTPVDLIFLDVDMPQMSGLDLLSTFTGDAPLVVLVTSSPEHAVAAFEHSVLDYLIKPVRYARFLRAAQKARDAAATRHQQIPQPTPEQPSATDHTFFKVDTKLVRVLFEEIRYVEALGDYIHVVTGQQKLIVYSTMRAVEEKFPPRQFVRVHRSFIVNLLHIQAVEDNVLFVDGKHIPIGQTYLREVLQRLNKF